jgi:catechol 2,3-dioxygenase-like lactoylglutathione lyase family enzyme
MTPSNDSYKKHTRLDHVGLTVPSIAEAGHFFETVLGARVLFDTGPYLAADDWMEVNLGVNPRAEIKTLRMLALPSGGMLELFEYASPDKNNLRPRNSDGAGHHVAFFVGDMSAAVNTLQAAGVTVMGDIKLIADGPSKGLQWLYFLAPWGLQLELVSYPPGWPMQTPNKANNSND